MAKKAEYKAGEFVVYPTHGVGEVIGTVTEEVLGSALDLLVIKFPQDRMTLRIPVAKAGDSGLRRLSSRKVMDEALAKLKGRAKVRRTMWSRRAQEYEAKINSGNPAAIAEVVRDLRRNTTQSETVLQRAADVPGRARPAVTRGRGDRADRPGKGGHQAREDHDRRVRRMRVSAGV